MTVLGSFSSGVRAGPKPDTYWNVEEIRAGMKGVGRTVMKGTKIESFDAEVLGVLRNTSPGRDLVLCRLSGLSRQNANRALHELARAGLLSISYGSVRILDLDGLRRFASESDA